MITIDPVKRPPIKSQAINKDELTKEIIQILQLIDDKVNKSEVYTKEEIDNIIIEDEKVITESLNQIDNRLVNLETWEEQ